MTLPKCCITCAFCYKKLFKGKLLETPALHLISQDDALQALGGDFSFLEKEKNEYENCYREYNEIKKEYLKNLENEECERKKNGTMSVGYDITKRRLQSDDIGAEEILGIESLPFGPVKEVYLCCDEKRFIDIKSDEVQLHTMLLNEFPCDFYFSIVERAGKDFEACRKERDLNRQKSRDELQERRLKIELENAENMQNILSETKEILNRTDEKIKQISAAVTKTNGLTNNIAKYTSRNEKSSKRYFWAGFIVSIMAIIVAIAGIFLNNKPQDINMFNLINIQKGNK